MLNTAKRQISYILVSTFLAAFSAASIIFFTDPNTSGLLTHIFFYASIFLLVLGIATVIGLIIRQVLFKGIYVVNLSHSFRQAVLIGILVVTSLLLSSHGLLEWWVELSLILLLACLEAFLNLNV